MSEPEKELSWDGLAERLGCSRQSLVIWRNREGAPSNREPGAWAAYIKANNLGARGPRVGGDSANLKDEKLRHEIELLKAKLDREKRQVIPTDEVNALLLHLSSQAKSSLYQFMETEAPPKLDGMGAAQMRPILREMADAICDKMSDLISDFETR